ncbi:MAG: hypothetical protein JFAIHJKO_01901 [Pyrinomonadaceae bacterium]|nr:hypothetical protein [Pyrinomonadaceae bacterium]
MVIVRVMPATFHFLLTNLSLTFRFLMVRRVLRMMMPTLHAEDHRASREEQQRFEERVRDEMEHPRHISAHPHRRDHETKLRNG